MSIIDTKLINAYSVLVLAERITIEEVPERVIILDDGTESTLREEVRIKVAQKTIEILS